MNVMRFMLMLSSVATPSYGLTVEFQEGAGAWTGTLDRVVEADGGSVEGSMVPTYFLDGDPGVVGEELSDKNLLLRFDGIFGVSPNQVPVGATILSAKLVLRSPDNPSGGPYVVGQLTNSFDGSTNYDDLGSPGFAGARGSVVRPVSAGYIDMKSGEQVTADITAIVRSWAAGATNEGMAIYSSFTTDSWEVATSSHPRIRWRPKLVVDYETDPVEAHTFAATMSALLDSTLGEPTQDGSLLGEEPLDADPDSIREGFFEFGGMFGPGPEQIAANERIVKAELVLTTAQISEIQIPTADTFDAFGVFPILSDWDLSDGDADTFPDLDYGSDGPTVAEGDIECAVAEFTGMGQDSEARADITELVKAWQAGKPNHGVNVKMTSDNGDSWYISWPGTTGAFAPRLEVLTVTTEAAAETGVVEFRNGVDAYAGTFQKRIDIGNGSRLGSAFSSYFLDGNPPTEDANDLIRFDSVIGPASGQVPSGATILSAGLYYTTGGASSSSASDGPFTIGGLTRAVDASSNYDDLSGAGGDGVRGIVGMTVAGYGAVLPGEEARAEVGRIVQSWANGEPNHGFGIFAAETTDSWEVTTICDVVDRRPRLRVDYTMDPVVHLSVASDAVAILQSDDMTLNGAAFEYGLVDGTLENQLLLGFDHLVGTSPGQLDPGAEVLKAWLVMDTGPLSDDNSSGPYAVREMAVPWSFDSYYSEFGLLGPTEDGGQTGPVIERFRGMGIATECRVDITDLVKSWQAGAENHGLVIQGETSDGWWVGMPGGDPLTAPRLQIITAGVGSGFDDWAVAAGLPGLAREDDGDRDGIPAMVEYGLGFDPNGFDVLPAIETTESAVSLNFTKGAEAAVDAGIFYEIHSSMDLDEWTKVESATETSTTIAVEMNIDERLFLRLMVGEQ